MLGNRHTVVVRDRRFGRRGAAWADVVFSFTTIDVHGASPTGAFGINNSGQIVGYFNDVTGIHGFLATPVPEPSALPLLAGCLIGLVVVLRQRLTARNG